MKISRKMVLGAGVLTGIGSLYLMMSMGPQSETTEEQKEVPVIEIKTQEVLALAANVSLGESVSGRLEWKPWIESNITEGFILRDKEPDALENLSQSLARANLYAGEPLSRNRLTGKGKSFLSSVLPKGMRALAVRIATESAAGGFILPNDRVDVIMTRRSVETRAGGNSFDTETILRNIRILAVDQAVQEDENGKKAIVGETATLELSAKQAEILTVAQQMAEKLVLALRAVEDENEDSSGGADHLLSGERKVVKLIKAGEISLSEANQ